MDYWDPTVTDGLARDREPDDDSHPHGRYRKASAVVL